MTPVIRTCSFSQKVAWLHCCQWPAKECEKYAEVEAAVETMKATYKDRVDLVVRALNAVEGIHCPVPKGAFYAWVDVKGVLKRTGVTTQELADKMLEAAEGVAVLPGGDFGPHGEGFIRLSLASSPEELTEGCARIKAVVDSLPTV